MNFRTPVKINEPKSRLRYDARILSLGSCFSVHIARYLQERRYRIMTNPYGITFNPASILSTIKSCLAGNSLPEAGLKKSGSLWVHHDFHGAFNHPDREKALDAMNAATQTAHSFMTQTDVVLITLGTAYIYTLDGQVVNNCHKRPMDLFERHLMSVEEISTVLKDIMSSISSYSKRDVRYIFTLSPVRHLKDGAVNNNLSKARLLQAIHDVCDADTGAWYFPAYEILLDELRDYRFYATDMVHPSEEAIAYIYNRFEATALAEDERTLRETASDIHNALMHRPLHPESLEHQAFLGRLYQRMEEAEGSFPILDYSSEKEKLKDAMRD